MDAPSRSQRHPPRTRARVVGNAVANQLVWWTCALSAGAGRSIVGVVVGAVVLGLWVLTSRRRAVEAFLIVAAMACGFLVDSVLVAAGAVSFPAEALRVGGTTAWMVLLWGMFSTTLLSSMRAVQQRPIVGGSVGALAGVVAYAAGARIGALTVHDTRGLVLIGAAWALALPALAHLAFVVDVDDRGVPHRPHVARRARTIPRTALLALVANALAPALLSVAAVVDVVRFVLARRPFMATRFVAFFWVYFTGQVVGLLALAAAAIGADDTRLPARTAAIQRAWAGTLLAVVKRSFRVTIVVEGDDCVVPAPILVLSRHTSIIDTLLPTTIITRRHGILLRWVLKKELLEDPCLDVAGNRLPNHFVARDGSDTAAELDAIRALATTMTPDQGCILFPEGTRATPQRRRQALAALRDSPLLPAARALRHVLPPRPGGTLALLQGAPHADVVVFAHAGLEGFAYVTDLWSGQVVGTTVRVKLWRIPRAAVPVDDDARVRWLYEVWRQVDDWVEAQTSGRPATAPRPDALSGA